nr:c-type cytochrome [Bacteriovorax sp. HI3]
MNKLFSLSLTVLFLQSCSPDHFHDDKVLGGKIVYKKELNEGHKVYQAKCLSCHGVNGDGTGITYRALYTKPRNLTQGIYKFGLSLDGGLPTDEDFAYILNHGLTGTAMLPWGLSPQEVNAVTQYIKTFAPQVWEGDNYKSPERPRFSKDPYKFAYEPEAIKKGAIIYHQKAQCFTCHKAYLPVDQLRTLLEDPSLSESSDAYSIKPQVTSYFTGKNQDILLESNPVDFKKTNVRSAHDVESIYKRIYVGVNGTAMPPWTGTLSDDELWAVAYYVDSLIKEKK